MAKKESKKQDRATEYIVLPNGCKFTPPYITPTNWESSKASVKKPWFIRFTFHDPVRGIMEPKWRAGNKYKTVPERQDAARQHFSNAVEDLKRGVNPFTGMVDPTVRIVELGPNSTTNTRPHNQDAPKIFLTAESPTIDCLKWAFDQYGDQTGTRDMRGFLPFLNNDESKLHPARILPLLAFLDTNALRTDPILVTKAQRKAQPTDCFRMARHLFQNKVRLRQ